jgi:hypothetical protein
LRDELEHIGVSEGDEHAQGQPPGEVQSAMAGFRVVASIGFADGADAPPTAAQLKQRKARRNHTALGQCPLRACAAVLRRAASSLLLVLTRAHTRALLCVPQARQQLAQVRALREQANVLIQAARADAATQRQ